MGRMEVKNMKVRELDWEQDNEMGSVGAYFYACMYQIYLEHPRLPINFHIFFVDLHLVVRFYPWLALFPTDGTSATYGSPTPNHYYNLFISTCCVDLLLLITR
jgi:hypothetical protein